MSNYTRIMASHSRNVAKTVRGGGKKYDQITYFPRYPGYVDPPVEPSKLFMVQRVKPFKGNPYWEKRVLQHLGLDGKSSEIAIVKNIPEMNAQLWKIKHLIKITPIEFPKGLPKDGDLNGTYLHENGTFMVSHKIAPEQKRIEATEKFINDPKRLDKETLRRDSRLKWLNPWSSGGWTRNS